MNLFVRILTFGWPGAITLAPFGIYLGKQYFEWGSDYNKERNTPAYQRHLEVINHENTHWVQQLEMMVAGAVISLLMGIVLLSFGVYSWWLLTLLVFPFCFFYLWYFIEWVIKILTPPIGAYKDLGFEREANCYEHDATYLVYRKWFAWIKRMFQ